MSNAAITPHRDANGADVLMTFSFIRLLFEPLADLITHLENISALTRPSAFNCGTVPILRNYNRIVDHCGAPSSSSASIYL